MPNNLSGFRTVGDWSVLYIYSVLHWHSGELDCGIDAVVCAEGVRLGVFFDQVSQATDRGV